jgi:3'-5' exonuclease
MRDPILVFDIETVPDTETGGRLHGLEGLEEAAVMQAMGALRLQARGNEFQPAHLQRIVGISIALRREDEFRVLSLGTEQDAEAELVRQFFGGIDKYRPVLVSWNGSGFDLPVLHYRALKHGIAAPKYWQTDGEAKWDNYLGRYQFRHTDLMDVLALYNGRNAAPLHEIAVMLGLPGKLGMDGSQVAPAWQAGRIRDIRAYCETDVLNTYLIYLRFLLMRGAIDRSTHDAEVGRARTFIAGTGAQHWKEFLEAWGGNWGQADLSFGTAG